MARGLLAGACLVLVGALLTGCSFGKAAAPPLDPAKEQAVQGTYYLEQGRLDRAEADLKGAFYRDQVEDRLGGLARDYANLAALALRQGDQATACGYLEKAVGIQRRSGDRAALARSLAALAAVRGEMGRQTARFDEAAGLVGEALGLVPEPGPVRVYALNVKGWLLIQAGDAAAAQKPLTEAMAIGRMLPEAQPQIVEGRLNAATRYYLGCSLLAQGKTAEARQMIEEALALDRESHYPQGIAADLTQLAAIEAAGGRLPEAFRLYERAFNIYLSLKDNRRAGLVLAELERAGREANLEAQVLGLREQLRQVETAAPLRPQAAPQQK